jgi:hypothetical protein
MTVVVNLHALGTPVGMVLFTYPFLFIYNEKDLSPKEKRQHLV